MPLTDARIRQAKPAAKPYKLADSGGLYLLLQPNGSKLWRYKYRIDRRENIYSIGSYPQISLLDARREHIAARDRVRLGEHPVQSRRERKFAALASGADTFRSIADEWYSKTRKASEWSDHYAGQVKRGLEQDLYPKLGKRPISEITARELREVLQLVEARGAPVVAINLRQWASSVFVHAIREERCESDPAGPLHGVILRPPVEHAKALPRADTGILLTRINSYSGHIQTRHALQLITYTFVRTVEMRRAEWSEFDLKAAIWQIPAHKMKKRRIHMVPLSKQAIAVVKSLRPLTGHGRLLFPNMRNPNNIMSKGTINNALEYMGYKTGEVTGHDFRATASTMLYEAQYREDLVEMQLAHVEANKTKRAYNHAKYLDERRAMMQWYADELDASAAEQAALALSRKQATT